MVKTIYFYFSRPFLLILFLFSFALTVIFLLTELFEKMDIIIKNSVSLWIVLSYLLNKFPFYFVQVFPGAFFIAVTVSFALLQHRREVMALLTCGISWLSLIAPYVFLSLVFSIGMFILTVEVAPNCNFRASQIYRWKIKKVSSPSIVTNLALHGSNNFFYRVGLYNMKLKEFKNIEIFQSVPGSPFPKLHLRAKKAKWIDGKWVFFDGIVRFFNEQGELAQVIEFGKDGYSILVPDGPEFFSKWPRDIREMDGFLLHKYIEDLKRKGLPSRKAETELQFRYAFSFSLPFVCFLGVVISSLPLPSIVISSVSTALIYSFLYWFILAIGFSLSNKGLADPTVGAWLANIFCLVNGWVLFYHIRR